MTDIPMGAKVECADHRCGRVTHVIIDRATQRVTHFVVREKGLRHIERLIAVNQISETTPDRIRLRCTRDELAAKERFVETQYWLRKRRRYEDRRMADSPRVIPESDEWVAVKKRHIPRGGLVVRWDAEVQAIDGLVGQVNEFLVDPTSGRITNLVLREGHLGAHKNVAIPISEVSRIAENRVYLKLDKHSVESLPAVPVRRD
jgi:uncharacterized protein YrrD